MYLEEARGVFNLQIPGDMKPLSAATFRRAVKKAGITRRLLTRRAGTFDFTTALNERAAFVNDLVSAWETHPMQIWVDETYFRTSAERKHAWSAKGDRHYEPSKSSPTETVTLIAAMSSAGDFWGMLFQGNATRPDYEFFMTALVIDVLARLDFREILWIWDKGSLHSFPPTHWLTTSIDFIVRPTANAEVIPIEYAFNAVKVRVKKRRPSCLGRIETAIVGVLSEFDDKLVRSFLKPVFPYLLKNAERVAYFTGKPCHERARKRMRKQPSGLKRLQTKKILVKKDLSGDSKFIKLKK